MSGSLKVCYVASEVAPFAKSGGLADVSAALPKELHRQGHDARLFMPLYGTIDTGAYGLTRVEFIQEVPVGFNGFHHTFNLWTGFLPDSGLSVYFVDCPVLFHRGGFYTSDADEPVRFALFCRAVLEACQRMGWSPEILHCNDWHTAVIPLLLRTSYEWDSLFRGTRCLMSIHNIGYQGAFHSRWIDALGLGAWLHLFDQEDLDAGRWNFLKTGLIYAHRLSTVSPTYAREIRTPEFGMGLHGLLEARKDSLVGILNGVDYSVWSPEHDSLIPHKFSRARPEGKRKNKRHLLTEAGMDPGSDAPLIGIISRLVHQKGFDLCQEVLPGFLAGTDARFVVLGTGETKYEQFFDALQRRFPGRVAYLRAYSEEISHRIEAAADMFLMPSRYEPCGLNQMFSLRYGTIPIVRRTGGLADTVQLFDPTSGSGNGVLFDSFDRAGLSWALGYAMDLYRRPKVWSQLMANAMAADYSWEHQAQEYVQLYRSMLEESV